MRFEELTEHAREHAYGMYVAAMDDDANRENILPIEEYSAAADWDGLEFDEGGEVY